jgi:hypothetical protein
MIKNGEQEMTGKEIMNNVKVLSWHIPRGKKNNKNIQNSDIKANL